jgi:hypothetical protein
VTGAGKLPRDDLALAQRLLDFLMGWEKDVVSVRDIMVFGPEPLRRNRENALDAAEVLVSRGWLEPVRAHRYDRVAWEIRRKPVLRPTVTRATGARL